LSISGDDLLAATCKPITSTREQTIGWTVRLHYVNHYHTRIPRPQLPINNGLQSYASDIQRQLAGLVLLDTLPDEHRQTIRETQRLVREMTRQIERTALLDELEAQGEVKQSEIAADALLQPVVEEQRAVTHEQGIALHLSVPAALSPVWCQVEQVRMALHELLNNVVQHASSSATASIAVHQEQGYTTFVISDSGPGIAPDVQDRLADTFYRAKHSNTRTGRIGLGVALVRAVASAHHGYFRIESTPGQGTTCTLMLPMR
jgi:signal transduction histidine kinase